jgi:hypothetical protein
LLGAVGNLPIGTNLGHVNKTRSRTDSAENALVVAFEDQSDGGEEVEEEHKPLSGDMLPYLNPHIGFWWGCTDARETRAQETRAQEIRAQETRAQETRAPEHRRRCGLTESCSLEDAYRVEGEERMKEEKEKRKGREREEKER